MKKNSRLSLLSFSISICLVVFIFFKLLSVYFGYSPLNKSTTIESKFVSVFPQGWAFFTKTSKEPKIYVFNVSNNLIEIKNLRNFSSEYCFGMSRHNRILSVEVNNIYKKIINDSLTGYKYSTNKIENLMNFTKHKKLYFEKIEIDKKLAQNFKGKYLIVSQRFLPWSLLHQNPDYPYSYTIYPVNIN